MLSFLPALLLSTPLHAQDCDSDLTTMTLNVGNGVAANGIDMYKLPDEEQLRVIASAIAQQEPAIVTLQEVMSTAQCEDGQEGNLEAAQETCEASASDAYDQCAPPWWQIFESKRRQECQDSYEADLAECQAISQAYPPEHTCYDYQDRLEVVQRLLGPDYTIVCSPLMGYDCVAVHNDVGTIPGCPQGSYCGAGSFDEWSSQGWGSSAVPLEGCDVNIGVFAVLAEICGQEVQVANLHPQAPNPMTTGAGLDLGKSCRDEAITQLFQETCVAWEDGQPYSTGVHDCDACEAGESCQPAILDPDYQHLVQGDFNFDPNLSNDEHPWVVNVHDDPDWSWHTSDIDPTVTFTSIPGVSLPGLFTFDNVYSDFIDTAECQTHDGDLLADCGAFESSAMDHRAVSCALDWNGDGATERAQPLSSPDCPDDSSPNDGTVSDQALSEQNEDLSTDRITELVNHLLETIDEALNDQCSFSH